MSSVVIRCFRAGAECVCIGLFGWLLWCVVPSTATRAQEPAQEQDITPASQYDLALHQALTAHAQGNYESAREHMERAHALEPSARTLRGLGIVAFAQGEHVAAIRYLEGALASEIKPLTPELRTSVEQLLTQVWSRVGRYELHIEPSSAELLLDGAAVDFFAPNTVVLEPGAHELSARAAGRATYTARLEVKPGIRETLHVVLTAPPQLFPHLAASPTPERRDQGAALTWWTPTLRYTGIGVGTALLLGGSSTWVLARVRLERVSDACAQMTSGACTNEEARRRYDDQRIGQLALSSAVLTGAGAALLIGTAALELYVWRQRERQLRAELGPHTFALRATF